MITSDAVKEGLLHDAHSCAGRLGRNRFLSWGTPIPRRTGLDGESV